MENVFYVKGYEVKHSMHFGSNVSKTNKEFIGGITAYDIQHFNDNNNNKRGVEFAPTLDLESGKISLWTTFMVVTEYRKATEEELNKFNKALADNNLVFESRQLTRWFNPFGSPSYSDTYYLLATYYINKDDMRIKLGNADITYRELKELGFKDGDKLVLSGDNGYSHCWASTIDAEKVFGFIENLFATPTEFNGVEMRTQSRAFKGEHFGWKFGEKGELILKVSKIPIQYNEVSFS